MSLLIKMWSVENFVLVLKYTVEKIEKLKALIVVGDHRDKIKKKIVYSSKMQHT